MRIGIDGRLWSETGVGRYIRALVFHLASLDKKNEYVLFLRQAQFQTLELPPRWHKVLADVRWHTMKEQLSMPGFYSRSKVEILHVPYFSVPFLTQLPFIVTIHDLTISHHATGKATTLPLPLYYLKRLGYFLSLRASLARAVKVITVSQTVSSDIVRTLGISPEKIEVTYESGELEENQENSRIQLPHPYILYVGNAHPHKNLERLIEAYGLIREQEPQLALVCVGKKDFFYTRLEDLARLQGLSRSIYFVGEVSNSQLKAWYRGSRAMVFPSLAEGFGIPGLEAMSNKCPVCASDIPVFHEIYGTAALYFNQFAVGSIAETVLQVIHQLKIRDKLVRLGLFQAQKYSWRRMARETLHIYENSARL